MGMASASEGQVKARVVVNLELTAPGKWTLRVSEHLSCHAIWSRDTGRSQAVG